MLFKRLCHVQDRPDDDSYPRMTQPPIVRRGSGRYQTEGEESCGIS